VKDIERMVISAYRDGEVEAPWREQVARKIAQEDDWAAEAAAQDRLGAALRASPEPDFTAARARVFAKVSGLSSRTESRRLPLAWLSVAAAGLLVLAAGGGYWWGRSTGSAPVEVSELQVQVPKQLELKLSGEGQLLMASTLEGTRR
jgi:anti-sigma factor RsiW